MSWLEHLTEKLTFKAVLMDLPEDQKIAIKNVLRLAEERLWLARNYHKDIPDPHETFSESCSERDIHNGDRSVEILKHLLQ